MTFEQVHREAPMKRLILVLVGVFFMASIAYAQEEGNIAARRGAAVYAEFCQACHGPQGEALAEGPAFTAIEYDPETTRDVITNGLDSNEQDDTAMPPYSQMSGGLLSDTQIENLIAYMETWATGNVPALPQPNIHAEIEHVPNHFGDPQAGAEIYATSCLGCHGQEGQGRVPPNFPPLHFNENTLMIVRDGHENKYMPAFGEVAGGPLNDQELEDLNTYMASWAMQEAESEPASPRGISTLLVILGVAALLFVAWTRGRNE
jgi:mono/diheme cytochrome c family protein